MQYHKGFAEKSFYILVGSFSVFYFIMENKWRPV